MMLTHVPTVTSVRSELAEAENEEQALKEELQKAHLETAQAQSAGSALLSAVEAAMAPVMRELAAKRRELGSVDIAMAFSEDAAGDDGNPAAATLSTLLGSSAANLEVEIKHLQLDISHFQEHAERLQAEERQRSHKLKRLREELRDAADDFSYERQRASRYAGRDHPAFEERHGRRLEIHAETSLRESAEQRSSKLARDITKLSMDTCAQQTTIEQLGRRLEHVRKTVGDKDSRLAEAARATSLLHKKIRGESLSEDVPAEDSKLSQHKKKGSASTGKLPHLSF